MNKFIKKVRKITDDINEANLWITINAPEAKNTQDVQRLVNQLYDLLDKATDDPVSYGLEETA